MAAALLRRGLTYYARVTLPPDRWADIGRAMKARTGVKREVVKTLQTTDRKTAAGRLDAAAAAIIEEVEDALRRAKLPPLTDWTADWLTRARERATQLREHGADVVRQEHDEDGEVMADETAASFMVEHIETEAEQVRRRQGREAAERFLQVATRSELSIAEGAEMWLAEEGHRVAAGTVVSHRAALRWLGQYLRDHDIAPSLDAVGFEVVTRRIAGEVVQERRKTTAWETVGRDFSCWNGLWRWAGRRGHVEANPWADQTTGIKAPREHDAGRGQERGYTAEELCKLLRAGPAQLAPNGGGYAATFFDVIRLSLLTGARISETMGLRAGDVLEEGTVIVVAPHGGKTSAASRIIPLHPFAQRVVADRLACLSDRTTEASLWPEVPALGVDQRRSKAISTRYTPLRERVLGESNEVDLHSFRRSFLTACETAMHAGGRINSELTALLAGHKRQGLAWNLYSDWSRIGRPAFKGALGGRLKTLREAVEDVVEIGMDEAVRTALRETAEARPAMKRTAPAFSRSV